MRWLSAALALSLILIISSCGLVYFQNPFVRPGTLVFNRTGVFKATGTLRGVSVSLDTSEAVVMLDSGTNELRIRGDTDEPAGEWVSIRFYTDAISAGNTYGAPEVEGGGSVETALGSSIIAAAEGYNENWVVSPSTLTIDYFDESRIAGSFDLLSNIGDTLSGSFDVVYN